MISPVETRGIHFMWRIICETPKKTKNKENVIMNKTKKEYWQNKKFIINKTKTK